MKHTVSNISSVVKFKLNAKLASFGQLFLCMLYGPCKNCSKTTLSPCLDVSMPTQVHVSLKPLICLSPLASYSWHQCMGVLHHWYAANPGISAPPRILIRSHHNQPLWDSLWDSLWTFCAHFKPVWIYHLLWWVIRSQLFLMCIKSFIYWHHRILVATFFYDYVVTCQWRETNKKCFWN